MMLIREPVVHGRAQDNARGSAAQTGGTLIVGPTLKFGGKANFTKTIFAALRNAGFEVQLFEASRSARPKVQEGDNGRRRNGRRFLRMCEVVGSSLIQKVQFARQLFQGDHRIAQIHVSSGFDFFDLSILVWIAVLLRRKVIVRCGGGEFDGFFRRSSVVGRWYVAKVLRAADRVIAQSDYWKSFISEMGVPVDRIHVIPNFVDVAYWSGARDEFPPAEGTVTFVFMPGGSEHRKGYHSFMPAFTRVADRRPNVRLRLIALGREVEEAYRPLVDRGQVEVLDFVSGEAKRCAIGSADVFALPTHSEGFPNALIEGMAAGLAVLSSRIPQITAIVDHGMNGLLVDPSDEREIEDAVEALCADASWRAAMGRNNIARCRERYDVELIASYFRKIYTF